MSDTQNRNWREAALVYLDRRIGLVALLGFSSGLPLLLVFSTMMIWLREDGVSLTTIGLFALVGQPYTFKFLWAPIIDKASLPPFTKIFGRRRGWALAIQLALMAAILAMGASAPATNPVLFACLALLVAFLSASQDIVLDALRIEMLEEHQYAAGAATFVTGYRIGMLAAGAGALFIADYVDWFWAYAGAAALLFVGMGAVLATKEPPFIVRPVSTNPEVALPFSERLRNWLHYAVTTPFKDFMQRRAWLVILIFAVLYKFGDSLAGVMAAPFYIDLGFSKSEVASVSKIFGLIMTLVGGFLGGMVVARAGILWGLMICGILQMLSNLMFAAQALVGDSVPFLTLTIAMENLSGGMGTMAFIAYLSALCNREHTATQYALLSSFMAFARTNLSAGGGAMAESLGWFSFFAATTLAALPGLLILYWMIAKDLNPSAKQQNTSTP